MKEETMQIISKDEEILLENKEDNKDDKEMEIDFKIQPIEVSLQSSRLYSYNPNSNQNHSKIVYQNELSHIKSKLLFHFNFQMTTIADFRMNIFEINTKSKIILIANDKKVQLISFNRLNISFDKPQLFLECTDTINQIKLMSTNKDKDKGVGNEDILLVLDNSGLLFTKKVSIVNKQIEPTPIKVFNCKINTNDNSIWSIDCHYPYIIIGGNHHCVMVFNYNDADTSSEQESKCIIYEGNQHNVPAVSISQCGLFICSNSIDAYVKVFDFNKGKMLLKIQNHNSDWGWGVQLIRKDKFHHCAFHYENSIANPHQVLTSLRLTNAAKGNKVKINQVDPIDESKLTPYDVFLKYNLVDQYYLLSTSQERASLYEIVFESNTKTTNEKEIDKDKEESNTVQQNYHLVGKPIGKIELVVNYISKMYNSIENLDIYSLFMIKNMMKYSRYEFILLAEQMQVMILGNKNGDIQIYALYIDIDSSNDKMGIKDEPLIILDCNERIAGIRIEEKGNSLVEMYVLTIGGMFYCYQITREEYF